MVRKLSLTLIICVLLCSALVFVSCSQEAGGGGKPGPAPTPVPKEEVVNELGQSKVIVSDIFDDEAQYKIKGDGSTLTYAAGKGIEGSDAILVEQNYNYGQVAIDMTKYYGRGKSYYIEAWFKFAGDVEGARTDNACANLDFSLITGAGYNYEDAKHPKHQTWDIPGQYDGSMLDNDTAMEIFGLETNLLTEGENLSDGEWHKVCGILDAENIESIITNMDELCNETGESSLYEFTFIFLVGTYQDADVGPGQNGYKYYMDNIKIIDLNSEIDVEGQTYEDPEEEEGEGEGGDA